MNDQHVSGASKFDMTLNTLELDAVYEAIGEFFSSLSESQTALLCTHLAQRQCDQGEGRPILHVVFDLLPQCNLACRGCGIDARFIAEKAAVLDTPLSTQDVFFILDVIADEARRRNMDVKLDLGGGEPLLRHDIETIVCHAAELFGSQSVGIDTNATLPQAQHVLKALIPHLSYLGVSLNGPRLYHNWWTGVKEGDPFMLAFDVVQKLCESDEGARVVEVTSVATSKNCGDLPSLMEHLSKIGVQRYSVHRAACAGRMRSLWDLAPSLEQYLRLLVELLEVSGRTFQRVHMHHSLERLFTALLTVLSSENSKSKACDSLVQAWRTAYAGKPSAAPRSVTVGITPDGVLTGGAWQIDGCPTLQSSILHRDVPFAKQLDEIILQVSAATHAACNTFEARCPLSEGLRFSCCETLCPVMRSMKRDQA